MALPPTIPTSFVPRSTGSPRSSRPRFDFSGAFFFISVVIFIVAVVAAIALFFYGRYVVSEAASKDAALQAAEAQVDQGTITSLVDLQNQLTEGKTLLDQHIVISQFFDVLQSLTPTDVTYSALSVSVNPDQSATVSLGGTAATFNALASLSADLATNPDIQDAIFSGIDVDPKGGVDFSLTATLDPALVEIPASGLPSITLPVATSTPPLPTATTTP